MLYHSYDGAENEERSELSQRSKQHDGGSTWGVISHVLDGRIEDIAFQQKLIESKGTHFSPVDNSLPDLLIVDPPEDDKPSSANLASDTVEIGSDTPASTFDTPNDDKTPLNALTLGSRLDVVRFGGSMAWLQVAMPSPALHCWRRLVRMIRQSPPP